MHFAFLFITRELVLLIHFLDMRVRRPEDAVSSHDGVRARIPSPNMPVSYSLAA